MVRIRYAASVAHEAPGRDKFAQRVHRRDTVTRSLPDDLFSIGGQKRASTNEQPTRSTLNERCEGCLYVAPADNVKNEELQPEGLCRVPYV